MSFKRFLNSHFVFGNEKHISFFQGSSFRFAVIMKSRNQVTTIFMCRHKEELTCSIAQTIVLFG